jgi:hypothetical protein
VTVYLPWLSSSRTPSDFGDFGLWMLPPGVVSIPSYSTTASFSIRLEFAYYSWMAGIIRGRKKNVKKVRML